MPTTEREAIPALLSLTQYVDLCMPRGGEGLIRAVAECSKVPVIKHYKGVCHVFVDRGADLQMAEQIVLNAKCQRPAVCNAMETLLVDAPIAATFLPVMGQRLQERRVALRVDEAALEILRTQRVRDCAPRRSRTGFTEYNDLILNVRVVDGVDGAIDHINQYGSAHSDSIVTGDEARGASVPGRGRFRGCLLECLDAFHRWRRVRHGRGDRHQHRQESARAARWGSRN